VKSWIHEAIYGFPPDATQHSASGTDKMRKYKVHLYPPHDARDANGLEDIITVRSSGGGKDYDREGCR
jgi:hypothetical protein